MKVGICGTGKMGTAIATRLLEKGHDTTAWNRRAERAVALVEKGAAQAAAPAALVGDCEAVIVMLYDDDAVEAVYGAAAHSEYRQGGGRGPSRDRFLHSRSNGEGSTPDACGGPGVRLHDPGRRCSAVGL